MREALSFLAKHERNVPFAPSNSVGEVPRVHEVTKHRLPPKLPLARRAHHQRGVRHGLVKRAVDLGIVEDTTRMLRSVTRLVVDVALWIDQSKTVKAMIQHPAAYSTQVARMRCTDEDHRKPVWVNWKR